MNRNKQAFSTTRPHNLLVSSTHPANAAKAAKLKVRVLQKQRTDRLADLQIQNSSTRTTCKMNTMAQLSDDFKSSRDHFPGSIISSAKAAPRVSIEGKQLSTSVKEYSVQCLSEMLKRNTQWSNSQCFLPATLCTQTPK